LKQTLKNTWSVLTQKERKRFAVLIAADSIISILDILSLVILLWIIQFYIQPAKQISINYLPAWLQNNDSILSIALFFIFFSLKNISALFIGKAHHSFAADVAIRISRNNLSNYQQGSFEQYINVDSSAHIRRIALQPIEFCQHILSGIQQIITQGCLIIITVTAVFIFNATLFVLVLLILLPPVVLVFFIIKRRLAEAKSNIRVSSDLSYRYLTDALKAYPEANVYGKNKFFLERFVSARRKFTDHLFATQTIQSIPNRVIEVFAIMGLFLLIAVAKFTHDNDHSTLVTIGAFMAAAYKIIPGIVKVINVVGQMRSHNIQLNELEKEAKIYSEPKQKVSLNALQLKDVDFSYKEQPVLANLSVQIDKGDFIAITGKSGRGKTTLFNIILGFLQPQKGKVFFNEKELYNDLDAQQIWKSVAYVKQQPFLIHDTILRNIVLEEDSYNEARLNTALQLSGVETFIAHYPEGLDKMITENGKNISGGQQQRISIARALYKDADVILLDEPFSELDRASTEILLQHFRSMASEGKIILMITHDHSALTYCSKTIHINEEG
jgi:ABC-type bacteriocin/lantibiotic exporter with double-glycine peptidase domain